MDDTRATATPAPGAAADDGSNGVNDDAAPVRALVVDDDPVIRMLVRRGLAAAGCHVIEEAADGVAAQPILRRGDIDLVVTDLLMPRLDGLGLMRWAAEHAPGPVWIILSGVERFDAAVEAIRLGAYEFLAKPPHVSQLETVVRNALRQRQLTAERARLFAALQSSNRALVEKVGELEAASEAARRDLRRAEVIQRVLLPSQPPELDGLCLHSFYRSGHFVGGDLYNVIPLGRDHVCIYVADATGHGVCSAMLSVLFHRRLVLTDAATGRPLRPAEVLAAVNRAICAERIAPGLFLTAAYCLLDTARGTGAIALAGHPPALLHRAGGERVRFERSGPALGLTRQAAYRDAEFTVGTGDRLLLYTDGLLDEMGGTDDAAAQLAQVLADSGRDGRPVIDALAHAAAGSRTADDDRDDVTLLLVEAGPGASRFDNGSADDSPARGAAVGDGSTLFYGDAERHAILALRGRATWLHADALHGTATALIDEGHAVLLDLADCPYLDSTMLGTLHEITRHADERDRPLELQRVPAPVAALFDELSLDRVIACVREAPVPLPEMRPLRTALQPDAARSRMLRAHQALAELSPGNREAFSSVLDALRSDE